MLKTKVVVVEEEREPFRFGSTSIDLVLICYDTNAVRKIGERVDIVDSDIEVVCPAKYALIVQIGVDDVGMIAQAYAIGDEFRDKAVWFEYLKDLPFAIQELKKRTPEKSLPDQVKYTIDWPFKRERYIQPGSSIIS